MNAVVREKKRFENALDDSVAAGLNAGTEVLMKEVSILRLFPFHGGLIYFAGGTHYIDADAASGVLPARGCSARSRTNEGVHRLN